MIVLLGIICGIWFIWFCAGVAGYGFWKSIGMAFGIVFGLIAIILGIRPDHH